MGIARESVAAIIAGTLALCVLLAASARAAESFPSRPLRMVVPFAPGGVADLVARLVSQKLGDNVGQFVIVDNRAGGGGSLAGETVAKARPDGYTLLLCTSSVAVINPLLSRALPYDPQRDLAALSLVSSSPYVLLVHPASPFANVRDLIAAARARPGALNYGSAGTGSASHLVGEVFKSAAKIDITHVPYKGTGPAAQALLAGELQMAFEAISASLPNLKAGRLRALGIATQKPFALLPDLPTIASAGVPGFEGTTWQGVCAPAQTPPTILSHLGSALVQSVRSPELVQRFASFGVESVGNSPEEFRAFSTLR